jgi:hypothetical protein
MKTSELKEIVKQCMLEVAQQISELSATSSGGAGFSAGAGAQYATPAAFAKKDKVNRATKYLKKLGYTEAKPKKRPYNTKLFDYLHENTTR